MPETNPLVAQRKDTTTPLAGTFLLEDGEALVQAINDKDWVAGGLAVVGGAFDAISEVVGSILSYAAELIATFGLAWPIVAEQIATRIASLIGQVGRNVKNLVTSARNLVKKLTDLKTLFHTLKNKLDTLFKNLGHHSDDLGDAGRNIDTHTRTGTPDGDTSFDPPAWAAEDRYIAPTREQQEAFADAVQQHGPTNPDDWIEHGNPNFATGDDPWTNNCGPCSRSFADTYQGGNPIAAYGDKVKGEGSEMYDILGAQPEPGLTNPPPKEETHIDPGAKEDGHVDPEEFTSAAYDTLGERLRQEPPGTVAIVGVDWDVPEVSRNKSGGHWFNAYVDDSGNLRWADEQFGITADWPPRYDDDIWNLDAMIRNSQDSEWRGLDLGKQDR